MKKLIAAIIAILTVASASPARAAYDPATDYMAVMISAATEGNAELGADAASIRDMKIDAQGLDRVKVNFDELYLLAKIAEAEAGDVSGEAGDAVCQKIMEVVINRAASPEFPDSVREVLYQRGQYYVGSRHYGYFEGVQPTERVLKIALRVLEGERTMTPDVVYHSNAPMGGGSAYSVGMGVFGTMYFSYSDNRGIYK